MTFALGAHTALQVEDTTWTLSGLFPFTRGFSFFASRSNGPNYAFRMTATFPSTIFFPSPCPPQTRRSVDYASEFGSELLQIPSVTLVSVDIAHTCAAMLTNQFSQTGQGSTCLSPCHSIPSFSSVTALNMRVPPSHLLFSV